VSTIDRVVITGGAGFLGSHLCDRFLEEGADVVCVDNLLTGRPRNVEHLFDNPRFQFVGKDVTKGISVDGPVSAVLHFASPASPADYLHFPIQDPEGRGSRNPQRPRPREGQGSTLPPRIDLRGVRRPAGASAA
jgi:nucleoside-diphosphate-sugar epimerase